MQNIVERAKVILSENSKIRYGIFSIIEKTDYFPPMDFLNEFLLCGNDPCDQDGRMEQWLPFELNEEEYRTVILWWQESHPKVIESSLSTESWHDWMQEVLESS